MTWTGGVKAQSAHAQLWSCKVTLAPAEWDVDGQAMSAFFERLGGSGGLIRIGDVTRTRPLYDRRLTASRQAFSDSSYFSDGTGFIEGYLPTFATAYAAAEKGADFIKLESLPASITAALAPGDLLEVRPNGTPVQAPSLYSVQHWANTDASGRSGVAIRPALRRPLAAGDMVVLAGATGVFRITDDEQGLPTLSAPAISAMGFSLIEAVDLL